MDKYLHEENRLRMAHRALGFGIAAMASSFILFSIPYIAMGLAFFSFLFAYLSKGYKPKLDKDARTGVVMGLLALVVSVSIVGSTIHKFNTDPAYRNAIYDAIEQFYGEDYLDQYGDNFPNTLDQFIGGTGNVDL